MSKKSSKTTEATATKAGTSKGATTKGAKKTNSSAAKSGKATKASAKSAASSKLSSCRHDGMSDMGVDIFDFSIDFIVDADDNFNEDMEQGCEFVDSASRRNRRV